MPASFPVTPQQRLIPSLGLFILLLSCRVSAADGLPPTSRAPLGLPQLVTSALEHHASVDLAGMEKRMSETDLDKAKAASLPKLEVQILTGPVSDAEKPFVEHGEIRSRTSRTDFSSPGVFARIELTVTQPLYTFGKIRHRREAAELQVSVKDLQLEQARAEIVRDVHLRYYGLVLAEMGGETAAEGSRFLGDLKDRTESLLDAGAAHVQPVDRFRIDAAYGDMKRNRARVEAARTVSYHSLKTLVGYPDEQDFEIADTQLPVPEGPLQEQTFFVNRALTGRPETDQLEKGLRARHHLWKASEADLYPDLFAAVKGAVSRAPGRERFNDAYIHDEFNEEYLGIVFGARWRFDFGMTGAACDRARTEYLAAKRRKEMVGEQIALEALNWYHEVIRARESVAAYDEASRASRRWLITSLSEFDMGLGSVKDVLDAIESYSRNRGNYLLSLFEFNASKVKLEYAAGLLNTESTRSTIAPR